MVSPSHPNSPSVPYPVDTDPQGVSLARSAGWVLGAGVLLAVSAQIQIPSLPVPFTLQTLAVLLIGSTLGSKRGVSAVLAYLAAGSLGAPVFAGFGGGLHHFAGPTAGFLLGFVPAVGIVGFVGERAGRRVLPLLGAYLLGLTSIYALGVSWLAAFIGAEAAVAQAALFLPGEAVKLALALTIVRGVRSRRSARETS
ncbi:MAG: biotin transporter BioY [Planctomycetota bacterium]